VMVADSMRFTDVVAAQATVPYIALLPLAFAVFFISGLAEVGRTPFDIYFAESEVVGGPFVEYSGAHWAIFFLAEYVNTFVVAALGALLFLGGWVWPFGEVGQVPAVAVFLGKTYFLAVVIFWVRATLPRLRIDQLMNVGWRLLIPLGFASVILIAVQRFYGWPTWTLTVMSLAALVVAAWVQLRLQRRDAVATAQRYAQRAVTVQPSRRRPTPENQQA
ncbi:MAG: NADH-quinone oxidoreductase subunit H, partial [Chloroflexi bacterium]|nr:NADH-quinone oxidoreductase subunit H [Chloroflexota bacterium]